MKQPYNTALYMRLSRDDETYGDSVSIETQRMILKKYADENGFTNCTEYVDDGYSGTNFERPAFKRMMNDIDAGRINCIIVKDLSRFGREHIMMGMYFEFTFPEKNVRFISVTENEDSSKGLSDFVPIKILFCEWYAKDTSKKVKAADYAKFLNGERLGAYAPLGYIKHPEIKNKLKDAVQDFQYKQAVELIKQNYEVELTRDNEVIIVTIPAERLFASNDTVLAATGPAALKPMLRYLKNPGFYKLLLVMHSDDTGSKAYTVRLTRSRVNAVYDWFDANGDVDYIVPYALGSNDPLNANDSMEKRRKNRRLEIYIVPNDVMLEQAKRGAININIIKKK